MGGPTLADRRSDRHDQKPVRRKQEPEVDQQQQQEPEKENKVPEQDVFGNSFMLDALRGGAGVGSGGPPAGGGPAVEQSAVQDWGGIEDADDPPPVEIENEHWFRPRIRKRRGDEPEALEEEAMEPGLPAEDARWLEGLDAVGEPWSDPSPQPPPTVLEGGLPEWLLALLPLSGPPECQYAIACALHGGRELQDPSGDPLLGTAAAATLGAVVGQLAGNTAAGRIRLARGLAIASCPQAPRDPARTAIQLSLIEATPEPLGESQQDPWLTRLLASRLGLERPPVPELTDPPPVARSEPGEPVDLVALMEKELGAPPDPLEPLRAAALDGCEAQARWAVALRSGAASVANTLAAEGVRPGTLVTVLQHVDHQVLSATGLLQEIAGAAKSSNVPIRGLRNGLSRSGRQLVQAHRATVQGLVAAAWVKDAAGRLPEPLAAELVNRIRDGRAPPPPSGPVMPVHDILVRAFEALEREDLVEVSNLASLIATDGAQARNGVQMAAGTLFQMAALELQGDTERAMALRDEVGSRLLGAGARSGLSLLARWVPRSQVAAGL